MAIYLISEEYIDIDLFADKLQLNSLLNWILLIITICRPVNIKFKLFFEKYAPEEYDNNTTIKGAGALIGNLERLLVAILMFYGQYASIGLVFTAKSITRFEKISKEPTFAEYYLIGSLYSIICVLVLYGIIMNDTLVLK